MADRGSRSRSAGAPRAVGWFSVVELDLASAPHLRQVLDHLCQDRPLEVVLDLAELEFLGASGLEVLLRADDRLRAAGGRLILNRPGRLVRRVVAITGLDTVLTIRPVPSPGLRSLAPSEMGQVS